MYVGNRVSHIIAPERWKHVGGLDNLVDCAAHRLSPSPSELLCHELWWNGPDWLRLDPTAWPRQPRQKPEDTSEEADELCLHTVTSHIDLLIPLHRYSTYTKLTRVTAWVVCFIRNCQAHKKSEFPTLSPLTVSELSHAKSYWIHLAQCEHFSLEISALKAGRQVPRTSPLISLNPLLDNSGLLWVGGCEEHSKRSYDAKHPLILQAKHPVARLTILTKHKRLLHARPSLLMASLS